MLDLAAEAVALDDPAAMSLADWLAAAREQAEAARESEHRSRGSLYDAIGRAWDFTLAALEAPQDFAELLADSGPDHPGTRANDPGGQAGVRQ